MTMWLPVRASSVAQVLDYLRTPTPKARDRSRSSNVGMVNSYVQRSSVANADLFRNWRINSEWVAAIINLRKDQVTRAEWRIGPVDPTLPWSPSLADRITSIIRSPNPRDKIYDTFIDKVLEDFLVLDAGAIEIVPNVRNEPVELWPVDARKVRLNPKWDGTDPRMWRFSWHPNGSVDATATWTDDQFIYMMSTPTTYQITGMSKLETLKVVIDSELGTSAYNDRQLRSAAPDGILSLGESARPDMVEQFTRFWKAEVEGRGTTGIIGGTRDPKWIPFRQSNRDMQFTEWQVYLVRKLTAVFGMNMIDLGFTGDVNRANAVVQQQNTDDRGFRPLLGDFASYMTSGVVQHRAFGGPANNLEFSFTQLNLKESESTAKVNSNALAGVPWKRVNEARRMDGYAPLEGALGDSLLAIIPGVGPVILDDSVPTAGELFDLKKTQAEKPAVPPPGSK